MNRNTNNPKTNNNTKLPPPNPKNTKIPSDIMNYYKYGP